MGNSISLKDYSVNNSRRVLACVVASHNSFLNHAFGVLRTGMIFTDKASVSLTGALYFTVILI